MSDVTMNAVNETPTSETPTSETPTPTPTVTVQSTSATIVPQFATTAKRGSARKMPKEPHTLLAYAIEKGGRVELTDATKQELVARGLPMHRIPNAAYGVRKFFGKDVKTERVGRAVSAYTITL